GRSDEGPECGPLSVAVVRPGACRQAQGHGRHGHRHVPRQRSAARRIQSQQSGRPRPGRHGRGRRYLGRQSPSAYGHCRMIPELKKDAEHRMQKSVESLKDELRRLRTGRAHAGLLESVQVEYYGSNVPIKQTANITVEDARTIVVTPWEKNMVGPVEKAII